VCFRLEEAERQLKIAEEEVDGLRGDLDITQELGIMGRADAAFVEGRFAVFRRVGGEFWIGQILGVKNNRRRDVDIAWYEDKGAAGMGPWHFKCQYGVSSESIVATLVRVPNTADQRVRLFEFLRSL
jgi:hypothetical protein